MLTHIPAIALAVLLAAGIPLAVIADRPRGFMARIALVGGLIVAAIVVAVIGEAGR